MAQKKTDEIIGGKAQPKTVELSPLEKLIQAQAQANAVRDFTLQNTAQAYGINQSTKPVKETSGKDKLIEAMRQSSTPQNFSLENAAKAYEKTEPYRESNYTGKPTGLYGAAQSAERYKNDAERALEIYKNNPNPTTLAAARRAAEMYGGADYEKKAIAAANPNPATYGAAYKAGNEIGGAAGMLKNKSEEYNAWENSIRPSAITQRDLEEIDRQLADPKVSKTDKIRLLTERQILEEEYRYGYTGGEYYQSDAALREALNEETRAQNEYFTVQNDYHKGDRQQKLEEARQKWDAASDRVETLGGTPNRSNVTRFLKAWGENIAGGVAAAAETVANAGIGIANQIKESRTDGKVFGGSDKIDEVSFGSDLLAKGAEDRAMLTVGGTEARNTLVDIAMNAMDITADMLLNLAMPGAGTARLAIGAFGAGANEAKERGAGETAQIIRGIVSAGTELITEGMFDGLAGVYGGGKADAMVDNLVGRIAGSSVGQNAWRLLFNSVGEGIEEVASDIGMGIADSIMFGDKLFGEGWNLQEMGYDFFIGSVLGFFGSGVDAATGGYKARNTISNFFREARNEGYSYKNALQLYKKAVDVQTDAAEQFTDERSKRLIEITKRSGEEAGADARTVNAAEKLSAATGREVRFFNERAGAKAIKNGYEKDGVIYINARAVNPMAQVFSHELTHTLEGTEEYDVLMNTVKAELLKNGQDYELVTRNGIRELYQSAGIELTDQELDREVMAQFAEKYLFTDEEKIMQFVTDNRSGAQKVWDWIKSAVNRVTGKEKTFLQTAEGLYAKAFKAAGNVKGTANGTVQYEIQILNGRYIPVINTEIDTSDYNAAYEYLKTLVNTDKPFETILSDSQPVYIGYDLPKEYKSSEYTKNLDSNIRKVKMQAATNLDEMIVLAENGEWRENVKEKHKIDAKNGWYRYETEFAVPILNAKKELDHYTVYSGTLLIRNDADGKSYLYDLINLNKKEAISSTPFSAEKHSGVLEPKTSDDIKPQPAPNVKTEFSLSPAADSEGNTLSKEQQEYFKNSEVRDEDGNLLVVYHGTDADFTVFDRSKLGTFTDGNASSMAMAASSHIGFWFNSNDIRNGVGSFLSRTETGYLNITTPYVVESLADLENAILEHNNGAVDDFDIEYGAQEEFAKPLGEQFKNWLVDNGYDGVVVRNDEEVGGTSYAALESSQFKRSDNLSPTENDDIRYSLSPAAESYRALAERIKKLGASDIKVTELTQKLKDLAEYATGAMYDPKVVRQRAEEIAREIVNESYEETGEAETIARIKNFLQGTKIFYQQKTAPTGYNNFEDFRRHRQGTLKFADDGRTLDSVYAELQDTFGEGYFPADIVNEEDILEQIDTVLDTETRVRADETMSAADIEGITQAITEQILQSDAMNVQPKNKKKIILPERARRTAAEWTRDEETRLVRAMASAFDLPDMVDRQGLKPFARQITSEYIRSGKLPDVFEQAYEQTRQAAQEAVEKFKEVKKYIRENQPMPGTDSYTELVRMMQELYPEARIETDEQMKALIKKSESAVRKINRGLREEADKEWSRHYFDEKLDMMMPDLKKLRKYIESKQIKDYTLTEKDSKAVDDILAGKMTVKRLDPKEYNIDAIRAELNKYENVPPETEEQFDETETERKTVQQQRFEEYQQLVASGEVKKRMDELKGKAKIAYEQITKELVKKMRYAMKTLWAVDNTKANEMAGKAVTEMLFSGGVSDQTINELFEEAREIGRKASDKYIEDYKAAAEYLNGITLKTTEDMPNVRDLKVGEEGVPIAEAYKKLRELADLPEKGTEVEMLWQMNNMAWRYKTAQKKDTDAIISFAKNDFANSLQSQGAEIRRLKRYMDYRTGQEKAPFDILENPSELYRLRRQKDRELQKARAKELLTDKDERAIEDIIKGELTIEELDPAKYNVRGINNVLPLAIEKNDADVAVRQYGAALRAALDEEAKEYTKNAQNWKDRSGFAASTDTMERNFIKSAGEDAKALIDHYIKPVHDNEAEKIRKLNSYIDRVEELHISQKVEKGNNVSEAYAVQLIGEAEGALDQFKRMKRKTDKNGDPVKVNGMTEDEWQNAVRTLKDENPNLNYKKIGENIKAMRDMYEELFGKVNLARVNNGYEPMGHIEGYFPHFQTANEKLPGWLNKLLKRYESVTKIDNVSNLPTEIAGTTENRKPGIKWFANAQQRTGFATAYDAVEGFERYIVGAMDVIYHTRDIQKLRALERELRFRTSDEGIRDRANTIRDDTTISDNERDALMNELYESGRYELSNLTQELSEYTNLLAGKRSKLDRNAEKLFGRNVYNLAKAFENRVAANMVALNPGSWLTNFIPIAQLNGFVESKYIVKSLWNIAMENREGYTSREDMQDISTFLTNRRGAERLTKSITERASETLSKPMEWIDMFAAEVVVRSRYYQNLAEGMSEENALAEADRFAAMLMADRSKGSMPTFFATQNPALKVFTQFQLEVNNQLKHFGDIKRDSESTAEIVGRIIKMFIATWAYDELYEALIGRRPGLDPLNTINDVVGDITGKKLPNLLRIRKEGFDTEKKDVYNTLLDIGEDIGENTPFVGGVVFDGGRLPISSAFPDVDELLRALGKEQIAGKKRVQMAWDALSPLAYYTLLPFGGGQIKKIADAVTVTARGGRYKMDNDGNMILQYPVITDGSVFGNATQFAQAALFGPTSTKYGREWVESGFKSFSKASTKAYKDAVEAGADQEETYNFLVELNRIEKTDDESKKMQQRMFIESADVSDEAKYYAYYHLMASDKEKELMDSIDADKGQLVTALSRMKDAEKDAGKRNVIRSSGLTGEEKLALYKSTLNSTEEREFAIIDELSGADAEKLVNTLMALKDTDKSEEERNVIRNSGLTGEEKLAVYKRTLALKVDGKPNKEIELIDELSKKQTRRSCLTRSRS